MSQAADDALHAASRAEALAINAAWGGPEVEEMMRLQEGSEPQTPERAPASQSEPQTPASQGLTQAEDFFPANYPTIPPSQPEDWLPADSAEVD